MRFYSGKRLDEDRRTEPAPTRRPRRAPIPIPAEPLRAATWVSRTLMAILGYLGKEIADGPGVGSARIHVAEGRGGEV